MIEEARRATPGNGYEGLLFAVRESGLGAEIEMVGNGIIHEILFRVMCDPKASALFSLAGSNTNLSRIDRALKRIHTRLQEPMDVDSLANTVNMSTTSFHRAFKEITSSSSPIQYIKKMRLDKAKTLLTERGLRVSEAATEVGYESIPQFSREFKRFFGQNPSALVRK